MRALITATEITVPGLQREVLEQAGFEVEVAQCRMAQEVIKAGRDASALLVHYAPVTAEVCEPFRRCALSAAVAPASTQSI